MECELYVSSMAFGKKYSIISEWGRFLLAGGQQTTECGRLSSHRHETHYGIYHTDTECFEISEMR